MKSIWKHYIYPKEFQKCFQEFDACFGTNKGRLLKGTSIVLVFLKSRLAPGRQDTAKIVRADIDNINKHIFVLLLFKILLLCA